MAILDKFVEFADAVSIAAAAGTANVGSQIDKAVALVGLGDKMAPFLVITVDVAIVTGGAAGTVQFALVSDDTASISTTTRSVHLLTPLFVTDDDPTIPAGTVLFCGQMPVCADFVSKSVAGVPVTTGAGAPYERYLGIQCITATTTTTAGTISAYLTLDPRNLRQYPDAQN